MIRHQETLSRDSLAKDALMTLDDMQVTKQTTMPAQGGNAATTGTSGAATGAHGGPTTQ